MPTSVKDKVGIGWEGSEQIFEKNAEKFRQLPLPSKTRSKSRIHSPGRPGAQADTATEWVKTALPSIPRKSQSGIEVGGTEHTRTNLPGHTTTEPYLARGLLPIFTIFVIVDHVEHDSRGEFVVCLATTLGCLKNVDGIPRTTTLSRLSWC